MQYFKVMIKSKPIIQSYLSQLVELATQHNISLLDAYKNSGVKDSTYYRNINGNNELQFGTAEKIARTITNGE